LSPDALFMHDGQIVILANPAMARLIGVRSANEMIGRELRDFIATLSWPVVEERIRVMKSSEPVPPVDETWRRADGSEVLVEVAVAPMPWCGPKAALVVARDVTERRRLEAEREKLLKEKERLVREVHHRVINSLQLVQSLLNLQARGAGSRDVQVQLSQAAARIGTIGVLHRRLQKDGSAVEGQVKAYMEGVMEDLRASFGDAYQRPILLETADALPLVLDADLLVALGLIAAEAIGNALEFGDGPIRVRLAKNDTGLELSVEDHGPGFPDGFDPASGGRGLGMRVMTSLAQTRGGSIAIGPHEGGPHAPANRIVATLPL
jgi:PAS domain S-box-containing protein